MKRVKLIKSSGGRFAGRVFTARPDSRPFTFSEYEFRNSHFDRARLYFRHRPYWRYFGLWFRTVYLEGSQLKYKYHMIARRGY